MRARAFALPAAYATAAVLAVACARPTLGAPSDPLPSHVPVPRTAVFLGSSTTAGAGASTPARRWTAVVSRRLGWVEVNRGLSSSTLTNIGRTVASGEERWRDAIAALRADVVFLMYGANDVLARVPLGDPETPGTFRHAAAEVLRGIREALPGATVIVCAPQPSRATAAEREPYDAALAEAAAGAGALFVPTGSAFPQERLGALSSDGLHLNDEGHAAVAEFILAKLNGAWGDPVAGCPTCPGEPRRSGQRRLRRVRSSPLLPGRRFTETRRRPHAPS